jgi:hypothetical protein
MSEITKVCDYLPLVRGLAFHAFNAVTVARLNAGKSSGVRLVMMVPVTQISFVLNTVSLFETWRK